MTKRPSSHQIGNKKKFLNAPPPKQKPQPPAEQQVAIQRYVLKRKGARQQFNVDKILESLRKICTYLCIFVNTEALVNRLMEVLDKFRVSVIPTKLIQTKLAQYSMNQQMAHPDYGVFAQHLEMINLHKSTPSSFVDVVKELYDNQHTKERSPLISERLYDLATKHQDEIDAELIHKNDSKYNYFALLLLQESFLLKINGKIVERPQHMLMRVALSAWPESLNDAFETYRSLSNHYFVPSHLMLQNAGLRKQQYQTSVALSLETHTRGLLDCLTQCSETAKIPADIGIGISEVIGQESIIPGTPSKSKGVIGVMQAFHNEYYNIRMYSPGPVAFYLEIWHKDIYSYLTSDTRLPYFNCNIIIPDCFMNRLLQSKLWYLMCPSKCPGLSQAYGKDFENLYMTYRGTLQFERAVSAWHLWKAIIKKQTETGYPSLIFKDNMNEPSNHRHLGAVNTSNKYTNLALHSKGLRYASAHSAYMILPNFCNPLDSQEFDLKELKRQVKIVTKFLNQIIDQCHYETPSLKRYNETHRPLAIGVHGLADLFQKLGLIYTSTPADILNRKIFEIIYYSALKTSCHLANSDGPYPNYRNSSIARKSLHNDFFQSGNKTDLKSRTLRKHIKYCGVRNSTFISLKPDKITAQIMGVSNSLEPRISNVIRIDAFGTYYTIINEQMMRDLLRDDLWNLTIRDQIIENHNCIKRVFDLHPNWRLVYKTAAEVLPRDYIRMARSRAPFVDQSQSTKIYLRYDEDDPCDVVRRAMEMAWLKQLKTVYKVGLAPCDFHYEKLFGAEKMLGAEKPADRRVYVDISSTTTSRTPKPKDPELLESFDVVPEFKKLSISDKKSKKS